jgi:hypothetical protein
MDSELKYELIKNPDIMILIYNKYEKEIWKDRKIIKEMVKFNGEYLKYTSEKFRDDKKIVYEAIKNNREKNAQGHLLEYVSEELKRDKEFILKLIEESSEVYMYINEELKKDKDFVLEMMKKNNYIYSSLEYYKDDDEIIKEALKTYHNLEYIEDLDEEKIIILLEYNIEEIIKDINNNREKNINIIKEKLKNKNFIIKLIKNKINIIYYLNKKSQEDEDIIKYSMIYLGLKSNKYKYISDLMENKYEYNYEKIRDNFKYIIEMDNINNIIKDLIEKDIKKLKVDDIILNNLDERVELLFQENGVHFVEILDVEDEELFIKEMKKRLKGEIIFYS